MQKVYQEIEFDDIDGGVWKQGWDISYDSSQYKQDDKLNVIIIPHSHNDPGWLMTFEEYFDKKTKNILDTIVNALSENEQRKFVWAEISYLALWWNQASNSMKEKFKKLVFNGQLELVTGGWVMNDEANTHYYSMIEQMISGHEWIKENIDAKIEPKNGWSIDPFGYSSTFPYLLKKIGLDHMLIQRVHYRIKKYLAQKKKLEFYWRQSWDRGTNTQIFAHVMPFYSYDVPHTCGPDPKICCQFDFARIDPMYSCPWGIPPQAITDENVAERAEKLLDQYRKKNQLYNHNVVLIPLGDDFRYTSTQEANYQFQNYEKLINYMNSKTDWNVKAQFGTLNDYFKLVESNFISKKNVNTLSGDFFTYADRNDHYWSGYYTSRPLFKRLDRTVEYYLRTAEILFSFANIASRAKASSEFQVDDLYSKIVTARRHLSLFQHHDGITGTAKTAVNVDYGNKLFESIKNSHKIIEDSVSFLTDQQKDGQRKFSIDDERLNHESLAKKGVLNIKGTKEKVIHLFNPSEHSRNEIISIYVDTYLASVYDQNDNKLDSQLNFVWESQQNERSPLDELKPPFELIFQVNFNGFEIKYVKIRHDESSNTQFSNTKFLTVDSLDGSLVKTNLQKLKIDPKLIDYQRLNDVNQEFIEIEAKKDSFKAKFSAKTGLLEFLNDIKVKIDFKEYGTTNAREKSGAYLFLPDGPGRSFDYSKNLKWIRVEEGTIRNRVCSHLNHFVHCVDLYPLKSTNFDIPEVSIWNLVDIRKNLNYELSMKISTTIQNNDEFYTDLNSFQFIKRKTYSKLPLQANVYPMPSGAYINDEKQRLTVSSSQSLGVCSLDSSSLEIFLDRRLNQDDNRGLEQPVLDNKLTSSRFLLIIEKNIQNEPSLQSQLASFDLVHPVIRLLPASSGDIKAKSLSLIKNPTDYPCYLRIINMRTMQNKNDVGVIFHRLSYNCNPSEMKCSKMNKFSYKDLFTSKSEKIIKTNLDLVSNKNEVVLADDNIVDYINPMEIESFKFSF